MVDAVYVGDLLTRIKEEIRKNLAKKRYEAALSFIVSYSGITYQSNFKYQDNELEESLKTISLNLQLNIPNRAGYNPSSKVLLFDSFGENTRGLAGIYVKALSKASDFVYVTFEDRKENIPDLLSTLAANNCECRFIKRTLKSYISQIKQLDSIIKEFRPKDIFFYGMPNDVVCTTVMYAYEGVIKRYLINLTDHAYWLGTKCADVYIQFRNYGAVICDEYRGIDRDKLVILPMYPIENKEIQFHGFPFELKPNQQVMFSGGSIYKTLGAEKMYYRMVEHILDNHKNLIFWYAGSGLDMTEMNKLLGKYPDRAFLTSERADLVEVLRHSDFYLSTYPLCGGLMFQYAALAGKVPVTLKRGSISDDMLLDQESLNVEFYDEKDLYKEVDKLLTDKEYAKQRGALMEKSIINEQIFLKEIQSLIANGTTSYKPEYKHIDVEDFKAWYLESNTKRDIDATALNRNNMFSVCRYAPLLFIKSFWAVIVRIVKWRVSMICKQ